jgi:hypothetical protein
MKKLHRHSVLLAIQHSRVGNKATNMKLPGRNYIQARIRIG